MGRFIDINTLEKEKINYILKTYNIQKDFESELDYFNYMKGIDSELINVEKVITPTNEEKYKLFMNWVNMFELDEISNELITLTKSNGKSKNDILKFINEPLRLEFLTALALQKKFTNIIVNPNYCVDDEGIPTSFATGGTPDIVCKDLNGNILFEVTLIVGAQQCIREMNSITRHLIDCIKIEKDSFSVILAPSIHEDTIRFADYIKFKEEIDIIPVDIPSFVEKLSVYNNIREFRVQA